MDTPRELAWLNTLAPEEAMKELLKCCGATRWAQAMAQGRPYQSLEELITHANETWWALEQTDWLEAFCSHPRIGERKAANPVSPQSRQWSEREQAGMQQAAPETIENLARLNREYEQKFGFIFIVCATGKSSNEILVLLEKRLENNAAAELPIAAGEQAKITELRLKKLIEGQ